MSKDKEHRDNVIPLRRKAETPRDRVKASLDKINRTMDELKQLAAKQTGAESIGEIPRYGSEAVVQTEELASTLPSAEEMEREYRRKKDEAKRKREQNNKNVTRDYNLLHPRRPPRK
jgi:hypothetical protein